MNDATEQSATVAGGSSNAAGGWGATVGGGLDNSASRDHATVGGGWQNTASGENAVNATVSGGQSNTASEFSATVGGGYTNTAGGSSATVAGGSLNSAGGHSATVGGGASNNSSGENATVAGGYLNTASTYAATVAGGYQNTASGTSATVPGGKLNLAQGDYSFAAGYGAKALHNGSFVWSDETGGELASTGPNQFLIGSSANVGIGTNSPEYKLHVNGDIGALSIWAAEAYIPNLHAGGALETKELLAESAVIVASADDTPVGLYASMTSTSGQVANAVLAESFGTHPEAPVILARNNNNGHALVGWTDADSILQLHTAVWAWNDHTNPLIPIPPFNHDGKYGLLVYGVAFSSGGWIDVWPFARAATACVTSPYHTGMLSGEGVLERGERKIAFDEDLSAGISNRAPIRVIVTPTSECNGLYVAHKSRSGFTVRELNAGRSNATFDWLATGIIKGREGRVEGIPTATPELARLIGGRNGAGLDAQGHAPQAEAPENRDDESAE